MVYRDARHIASELHQRFSILHKPPHLWTIAIDHDITDNNAREMPLDRARLVLAGYPQKRTLIALRQAFGGNFLVIRGETHRLMQLKNSALAKYRLSAISRERRLDPAFISALDTGMRLQPIEAISRRQ
jgi:hypothetical protein